ncbi:hypothetical protein QG37_03233 [Candidozyma auris]|uniref:Uncharacterized protein n=1 Tax=Candidozyma auris TaxID=498019 RepID=A0A0L0P055_CANAR|nr:hypothetical protein QG37_03233 [[Candida] auris]
MITLCLFGQLVSWLVSFPVSSGAGEAALYIGRPHICEPVKSAGREAKGLVAGSERGWDSAHP